MTSESGRREHCQSTVRFEPPFWILLLERWQDGRYGVVRRILGASEPGAAEIRDALEKIDFLRLEWAECLCLAPVRSLSPKRLQREIAKATEPSSFLHVHTKAQEVLKAAQQEKQRASEIQNREERQAQKERLRELSREKKKRKLRGK